MTPPAAPRISSPIGPVATLITATTLAATGASAIVLALLAPQADREVMCVFEHPAPPAVPKLDPGNTEGGVAPPVAEQPKTPPGSSDAADPGPSRRLPHVRQAKPKVRGGLDKDIIRRVVRAHLNEVRHCYNEGLARDPALKGRVAVQFTIGPMGRVPVAAVQESSVADHAVGRCIAKAVRRWRFPKVKGGGNVVVTYPFVLTPG